jgi:tetratricopeptide (TPR) repeat protein
MSKLRRFEQKLSIVSRLWEERNYDSALVEVESLLELWPGNANLHILWASLVQLQEDPKHDLDEVKQALQQAVELDKGSPAAAIELGHFLDKVEDDLLGASKAYAEGVATARHLLIEGLIGQAKAFRQLDKREEFLRCLLEVLHLTRIDTGTKRIKAKESGPDIIFESPTGHFHTTQIKGRYAEQILDLLGDLVAERSAFSGSPLGD